MNVVPQKKKKQILQLSHDHSMLGHFAVYGTYNSFKHLFFWPKSYEEVVKYVSECKKCNELNIPGNGYVNVQPINTFRWFGLIYDLAGPFLPVTVRGDQYALILVDHYARWSDFVPEY